MPKTYICLGRCGDLLSLLPLLKRDFDQGAMSRVVVLDEFASVLSGVGYVEPIIFKGHIFEIQKSCDFARGLGGEVVCAMVNGPAEEVRLNTYQPAGQPGALTTSWQKEVWRVTGNLKLWDDLLPLIFDKRSPEREAALLARDEFKQRGKPKPVILLALGGDSSPFPYVPLLRELVYTRFRQQYHIVELPRAERIYDLLGVYEKAALLISTDSAPLHLAWACRKLPVIALTNDRSKSDPDKMSLWHGSSWRPNHYWYCRYHDWPQRALAMLAAIEGLSTYVFDPQIQRVWSEYGAENESIPRGDSLAITIGSCGRDSETFSKGEKREPYLKDALRMAIQRAHGDETWIMLHRPSTGVAAHHITDKPPFFAYRITRTKESEEFSPVTDVFCATRADWKKIINVTPDLRLGRDFMWSECLRVIFQRIGAKDLTGIAYRESTPPKPVELESFNRRYNRELSQKFLVDNKVFSRYPKVSEQVETIAIDTSKIPKFAYNPSLIRVGDKLWMTYRYHTGDYRTRLGMAWLSNDFKVMRASDLSIEGHSVEDARLFLLHGEPWMSWVESNWDGKTPPQSVVKYGMLTPEWKIERAFQPRDGGNDWGSMQKNWCFFESDENLFCIYRSQPDQTVMQIQGDTTITEFKSGAVKWPYGEPRGGNIVPYDGKLLRIFHSSLRNELDTSTPHRYYIGALLMEPKPPFNVIRVGKKPIIYGSEIDSLKPAERKSCFHFKRNVAFPTGLIECNGGWILALGVNDAACALVKLKPENLHL